MPSSHSARPTCVSRSRSTLPPAFGVSQKWLPRSEYSAQKIPLRSMTCGHYRGRRFLLDQLRVVDFAGRVVEDHDQVVPALVLKPLVLAAVDMQQHPRHRTARTPLAMHPALAPSGHQSRALQCQLHPGVAQIDPVLVAELLVKMPHVQVEIPLAIKPQHLLHLGQRHPPAARRPPPPVEQPVVAMLFVALPPPAHRAIADADNLRCLPPRDPLRHRP